MEQVAPVFLSFCRLNVRSQYSAFKRERDKGGGEMRERKERQPFVSEWNILCREIDAIFCLSLTLKPAGPMTFVPAFETL